MGEDELNPLLDTSISAIGTLAVFGVVSIVLYVFILKPLANQRHVAG
jgi:hypothetical protein